MNNLHAELVAQPGSRADFARLARAWLTGARRVLFTDIDRRDEVTALPGGQVFLRATPALSDYEGAAMRQVFGVLAPVLPPGRPDPAAVSGQRVRLVLDADAADAR